MCAKKECNCPHLDWIKEGDKRLKCRECGCLYVLVDGLPTIAEKAEESRGNRMCFGCGFKKSECKCSEHPFQER